MSAHQITLGGFSVPLTSAAPTPNTSSANPAANRTEQTMTSPHRQNRISLGGFTIPIGGEPAQPEHATPTPSPERERTPPPPPPPPSEEDTRGGGGIRHWRYRVRYDRAGGGRGEAEVGRHRPLSTREDVLEVQELLSQDTGCPVFISGWDTLSTGTLPAATTALSPGATAGVSDPLPWQYWLAYNRPDGTGTCVIFLSHAIGTAEDRREVEELLTSDLRMPITLTAWTPLSEPTGGAQ